MEYEDRRLHGKRYFGERMAKPDPALDQDLRRLLEFSRSQLCVIDGVGPVTPGQCFARIGGTAKAWTAIETAPSPLADGVDRSLYDCGDVPCPAARDP